MNTSLLCHLPDSGWIKVRWPSTSPLHVLANHLFLKRGIRDSYRVGQVRTLIATTHTTARAGTKSSIRGLSSFPLHTDEASRPIPPRFILLRSLTGRSSSATLLLPFRPREVGKRLLSDLSTGQWVYRGSRTPHICSVWENSRIKWDEDCMRPLDRVAKSAHVEFRSFLASTPNTRFSWSNASSVLVIDNWGTMHGREAVPHSEHREIERAYVEVT